MAASEKSPPFEKIQVRPAPPILPHSVLWAGVLIPMILTTLVSIFVCALTGPNIVAMIPILVGISFGIGPAYRMMSEVPVPRRGHAKAKP